VGSVPVPEGVVSFEGAVVVASHGFQP